MTTTITLNENVLDDKLSALEQARQWTPRVISKLETLIRTGSDLDLFRISPIQYALDRGMSEQEAIDLFLYGVKFGLFEMEWHMVCASCGRIVYNLRTMARLHSHFVCTCCSMENQAMLDDFIQAAFTISSSVRQIRYHQPDTLTARERIEHYGFVRGVASPYYQTLSYTEFFEQQHRFLDYLEPNEKRIAEFNAVPGVIVAVDVRHDLALNLLINPALPPAEQPQPYQLRLIDGRMEGLGTTPEAQALDYKSRAVFGFPVFTAGPVKIELENKLPERAAVLLMQIPAPDSGVPEMRFEVALSGKRLLSHNTFRELFRSEIIQSDEGIGVRDVTFMFTDLKGSTALYDQIGDAKAYYLVRQHFDTLGRVINQHNGAVVKTIGDAVMATFVSPKDAAAAALEMLNEIEAFNRGISEKLSLKIGIHRGHSIVVTLNDRLDYFGQTVNIASRIQNLAGASEIYLSDTVYEAEGIDALLGDQHTVVPQETLLKGVGEKMRVYQVTVSAPVAQTK